MNKVPKLSFQNVGLVAFKMDETQAKHIKEKIGEIIWNQKSAQEPAYWKPERVAGLYGGQALNSENLHDLIRLLIEDDVFNFLPVIAGLLVDAASDSEAFAKTLVSLESKIGNDMASGPITKSIQSIGSSDPEMALQIAERLLKYEDPRYSYLLIGGAATRLPGRCKALMQKLLGSDDARLWPVAIKSLVVTHADSDKRVGKDVLKALDHASELNSIDAMVATIDAFIVFYASDKKRCGRAIERLASKNPRCAWLLARRIWTGSPFDEDISLQLLFLCSKFSDINVRQEVCRALRNFVGDHLKDVLRVVVLYTARDGHSMEGGEYLLKRIGEIHGAKAVTMLLDMLDGQTLATNLRLYAPRMIMCLLAGADNSGALEPVFKVIRSKPDQYKIGIEALREVISDSKVGGVSRDSMLEVIRSFLECLAKARGINTDRIIQDESDQAIRCGHIIHAILNNAKPPDYELVRKNMECFPEIHSLFGQPWVNKMQRNKRIHPILSMLGQELPSKGEIDALIKRLDSTRTLGERVNLVFKLKDLAGVWRFLYDLDRNLRMLKQDKHDTARYAKHMKNEKQFWDTISEINFIMQFLNKCIIDIEPKIGTKKLDARLDIEGRSVYVEIFNPEMFLNLKLFSGAQAVPNRIPDKIYDKFKNQLYELDGKGHPVLLAIDIERSRIHYDLVEDYLLGPVFCMLHFNQKGEAGALHEEWKRDKSMHMRDPGTDVISAVVCYKMRSRDDLTERMEWKIFYNPHARSKIDTPTIQFLEECLDSKRTS